MSDGVDPVESTPGSVPAEVWSKPASEVAGDLAVQPDEGLEPEEVESRRREFGENRLREAERRSGWQILVEQFKNLVVALLAVAAGVSVMFGHLPEAIAIGVVLVLNTAIGFATEYSAARSLEALREMGDIAARVIREGEQRRIHARQLVPGDVFTSSEAKVRCRVAATLHVTTLSACESSMQGGSHSACGAALPEGTKIGEGQLHIEPVAADDDQACEARCDGCEECHPLRKLLRSSAPIPRQASLVATRLGVSHLASHQTRGFNGSPERSLGMLRCRGRRLALSSKMSASEFVAEVKVETMRRLTVSWVIGAILTMAVPATAADYYVSPSGSDGDSGSEQQPWRHIDHAVEQMSPGDTLHVGDGTYQERVKISAGESGEEGAPIRIVARNDGEVVVDGSGEPHALTLNGNRIVIEGIVFKHADRAAVVTVNGDHNVLRRVSAYDSADGYDPTYKIRGRYNLIVDSVGAGAESHIFNLYSGDGEKLHNVLRRNFAYGGDLEGDSHGAARSEYNIYGSSNNILENCIGWGGSKNKSLSVHGRWDKPEMTIKNNQVYGSIFRNSRKWGMTLGYGYDSADTLVENSVFTGNGRAGIRTWGGLEETGETFRNVTVTNNGNFGFEMVERQSNEVVPEVTIENAIIAGNGTGIGGDSDLLGSTSATYTNSWGNDSSNFGPARGNGCISKDPKFSDDEAPLVVPPDSPCKGAGKNGADMGANVYYRYENGEKTDQPLWPWPMQQRIEDELGIDVTGTLAPEALGPMASASATPSSGRAPLEVEFEARLRGLDGSPSSVEWTFGDGSSSETGETVVHTYEQSGQYTATLKVTTADGETLEDSVSIAVDESLRLGAQSVEQAPTIDGALSEPEWVSASAVEFQDAEQTSENEVAVTGLWDDSGLTLGFEVEDDELHRSADADPWRNDGVEFAIDVDRGDDSLDSADRKWIVELDGSVRTGAGAGDHWTQTQTSNDLEAAVQKGNGSYTVEVRVPWSSLNLQASPAEPLGLLLANNDREAQGDRRQFLWAPDVNFDVPSTWGRLALESDTGDTDSSKDAGIVADTGADNRKTDTGSVGEGSDAGPLGEDADAGGGSPGSEAGTGGGCSASGSAHGPIGLLWIGCLLSGLAVFGRRRPGVNFR